MYGMVKTTVYLPEELKRRLARLAAATGRSEAELIRDGVARVVDEEDSPEPRLPLFSTGDGTLSKRVDEILAEGFGRD